MTDCNAKKIAEIVGRVVCSFEHGKGDETGNNHPNSWR